MALFEKRSDSPQRRYSVVVRRMARSFIETRDRQQLIDNPDTPGLLNMREELRSHTTAWHWMHSPGFFQQFLDDGLTAFR